VVVRPEAGREAHLEAAHLVVARPEVRLEVRLVVARPEVRPGVRPGVVRRAEARPDHERPPAGG
jgi:hypothetical protein